MKDFLSNLNFKRIISAIFVALFIGSSALPVWASSNSENVSTGGFLGLLPDTNTLGVTINEADFSDLRNVNVRFSTVYETAAEYEFPYSDEFFSQPANSYSHTFARGCLGLAVASFRSKLVNNAGYADLESYFTSIGFGNVSAEPYNEDPTANSVTYAIASKQIGDQTVIAVVCCGAGYGAEWSSNLTIGDGTRHQGFGDSARIVEDAIAEYIDSNGITGRMSLWTTGYSRAAAISNILAADMTDEGIFQRVYCYTFATPRTVMDAGSYSNIFNIIGKNDPVPSIPFADWGYTRYGTDLYLPTLQMDSDYASRTGEISDFLVALDGHKLMYNPIVSSQLQTFFDYLYNLVPESSDYYSDLQPGVLQVMADSNNNNILMLVSRIISTFSPDTPEEKKEISELIDYVQQLINEYVFKGNTEQKEAGMWDASLNVTQNLTNEHDPDKYIAWMFYSDDPEQVFGQNTEFRQFTIKGPVDVLIYDEDGYIETLQSEGKTFQDPSLEDRGDSFRPSIFTQTGSDQFNLTIPSDRNYILDIKGTDDTTVTYYATTHSVSSVRSDISKIYTLKVEPGKDYYLYSGTEKGTWVDEINTGAGVSDAFAGSAFYSPSVILRLQNINILHLTLQEIILFAALLLLFSYTELIVCATLGVVRTFQGYQRRSVPTILMHFLNAAIFLGIEIAMWYFVPAFPIAKLAAKIVSFLFIFTLALVALTEYFSRRNIIINIGLLVLMVLSCIFENYLLPTVSLRTVLIKIIFYAILAAAAAFTWKGHNRRRAFKIAEIEKKRYEKKLAKADKAMQKAYDKSERETQKYLARQKKKAARASKKLNEAAEDQ